MEYQHPYSLTKNAIKTFINNDTVLSELCYKMEETQITNQFIIEKSYYD